MDVVLLIGRILFASVFIVSGSTVHLLKWRDGVAYARAKGVPAPELLVPASGLMAVGGGVLLVLGLWADLGALLLAAFVFPVAIGMHAFWKSDDPMERMQEQIHFMKDFALGAARWRSSRSSSSSGTRSGSRRGRPALRLTERRLDGGELSLT
jgi:putative oxidoreductase